MLPNGIMTKKFVDAPIRHMHIPKLLIFWGNFSVDNISTVLFFCENKVWYEYMRHMEVNVWVNFCVEYQALIFWAYSIWEQRISRRQSTVSFTNYVQVMLLCPFFSFCSSEPVREARLAPGLPQSKWGHTGHTSLQKDLGKVPVSCVALGSALQVLRCSSRTRTASAAPCTWDISHPRINEDLDCMGQRKQFEYARNSEDCKEHLKTYKSEPKATQLTGTFQVFL